MGTLERHDEKYDPIEAQKKAYNDLMREFMNYDEE